MAPGRARAGIVNWDRLQITVNDRVGRQERRLDLPELAGVKERADPTQQAGAGLQVLQRSGGKK